MYYRKWGLRGPGEKQLELQKEELRKKQDEELSVLREKAQTFEDLKLTIEANVTDEGVIHKSLKVKAMQKQQTFMQLHTMRIVNFTHFIEACRLIKTPLEHQMMFLFLTQKEITLSI